MHRGSEGEPLPGEVKVSVVLKVMIIVIAAAVLYLYAIMPRLFHRPDFSIFKTKLFAHRGLFDNASDAPENSQAAFRKAVGKGFGIELDVHLSRDGIPVVFHDFKLKRMTGLTGNVEDYTAADLAGVRLAGSGETIPTLEEALSVVQGKVPLIIEIKSENLNMDICRRTDDILRRYQGQYCIESFNPFVLLWYRMNRRGVLRGQLSDHFTGYPENRHSVRMGPALILQNLLLDFLSRPDFVAYNCKYQGNLSRRLCRCLFGGRAAAWVVQSREQLRKASRNFDIFIFDSFIPQ